MKRNGVIIGTFVKKTRILSFLEFLKNKFNIGLEKTFIFEIEDNTTEYLVTFSSFKNNPYFKVLHDATILHTKNGCLFSINALNKYIESSKQDNSSKNRVKVDWSLLKNMLMITTNGKLKLNKLIKLDNINKLFKI